MYTQSTDSFADVSDAFVSVRRATKVNVLRTGVSLRKGRAMSFDFSNSSSLHIVPAYPSLAQSTSDTVRRSSNSRSSAAEAIDTNDLQPHFSRTAWKQSLFYWWSFSPVFTWHRYSSEIKGKSRFTGSCRKHFVEKCESENSAWPSAVYDEN